MIKKIMESIENSQFTAITGIASSFSLFIKIIEKQDIVKELIEEIYESLENRWIILSRISELLNSTIDPNYENPYDTAISVYLWALSLVDLELSQTAAAFILNIENGWWSKKFAQHLMYYKDHETVDSIKHINQIDMSEQYKDTFNKVDPYTDQNMYIKDQPLRKKSSSGSFLKIQPKFQSDPRKICY
jgi:hypothetical protein